MVHRTKLEKKIHSAMLSAHKQYLAMTGYWLSHAPESYITVKLAQDIFKSGYNVYIDSSLKKILNDRDNYQRGGKRKLSPSLSKRSDISVVYKSRHETLAAIEVKRAAYYVNPVLRDTKKLNKLVGIEGGATNGYVVAYSEAKYHEGKDTLKKRFADWAKKTNWALVSSHTDTLSDGENWVWGFCVLRSKKSRGSKTAV
jgi:hypothetical protein